MIENPAAYAGCECQNRAMAAIPDTLTAEGLVLDAVRASFGELRQWMDWAKQLARSVDG